MATYFGSSETSSGRYLICGHGAFSEWVAKLHRFSRISSKPINWFYLCSWHSCKIISQKIFWTRAWHYTVPNIRSNTWTKAQILPEKNFAIRTSADNTISSVNKLMSLSNEIQYRSSFKLFSLFPKKYNPIDRWMLAVLHLPNWLQERM